MGLIGGKPKQWFGRKQWFGWRRWVGDVDWRSMIWGWVSVEMEDVDRQLGLGLVMLRPTEAWVGDVERERWE